ncbi:MAG: YfjI family protein [Bacilli bacterium]
MVAKVTSITDHLAAAEKTWPTPQALPDKMQMFATPHLEESLLPRRLRAWVVDVAMRASLPLEMVAVPAMVSLAAILARRVGIRPSRLDDFTVICNLYGAIVGRPGLMKSHAVSSGLQPLTRIEAQEREKWKAIAEETTAKRESFQARIAGCKQAIQQAAKKGQDVGALEISMISLMHDLNELPVGPKRYVIGDATQEKIADLLIRNTHGLVMVRDELAGWLAGMEQENHRTDRGFFLNAWNGSDGYSVDRIGRGSLWVPTLCLSIIGGIQPAKLRRYIDEAVSDGGADGLLSRFQLLVWPDDVPAYTSPGAPDHGARQKAFSCFEHLATVDVNTFQINRDEHDADTLPYLHFSPDAQIMHDEWRASLERRLRSGQLADTPAYEAHISKFRSLLPSLALMLHLGDGETGDVSLDAVKRAASWCTYLDAHARKVYRGELDDGTSSAHALAHRIKIGDVIDGMLLRDLYRKHWGELTTKQAVVKAIDSLTPLGWVRIETQIAENGRDVYVLRVNPAMRENVHL